MEEKTNKCLSCHNEFNYKIILSDYKCPITNGCKRGINGDWFCIDCIKKWDDYCLKKFRVKKCPLCNKIITNKNCDSKLKVRYGIFNYIRMINFSRWILNLKIKLFLSICIFAYYYNIKLEVRLFQLYFHHYLLILFAVSSFAEAILVLPFLYIINYGYS